MTTRHRRGAACLAAWLCVGAGSLSAHRLDEYLQATLVSIGRNRIDLEINLTPGVAIAPQVLAGIDRDGSGNLSSREEDEYVSAVLAGIALHVDGRPYSLTLTSRAFPTLEEMREGLGTIRLNVGTDVPEASAGSHQVLFRNMHRPELSVYLANALIPQDLAIAVTDQQRDVQQHELRVSYQIAGVRARAGAGRASAALFATVVVIIAATLRFRRQR